MDGSMQVLRLLKTLKDYFKQMFRLLQVIFRVNFKDDFKTTILNSTQLGTTQPQLVEKLFFSISYMPMFQKCAIGFSFKSEAPNRIWYGPKDSTDPFIKLL